MEYGHGGEEMVDDVIVGYNVAMLCQSSIDESFWIMLIELYPYGQRTFHRCLGAIVG